MSSFPGLEFRVIDVLYWIGSVPFLLASLFVGWWAWNSLYVRPRQGWLILVATGITLLSAYGMRVVISALSQMVMLWGMQGGLMLSLVSLGVSTLLSVAVWSLQLTAIFGRDDSELVELPEGTP